MTEIGASAIPTIMVYNKIDLTGAQPKVKRNAAGLVDSIWLSAHSGQGIDLLMAAVTEHLSQLHTRCRIILPASEGKLRASLYQKSVVKTEAVTDDGSFELELELSPADFGWLQKQSEVTQIEAL